MKRSVFILLIFLSIFKLNAQKIAISDSAIVSLITCSPGEEVYAKFGHTAIRINDSANGIDLIFNYGIFSFDTPNFYYKFLKGETDYQLGVSETASFLPEYKYRNSMVWEQKLNMTVPEKKHLISLLFENYEPQNRVYRYNFIFDNCATRPRDKILSSFNGYARFLSNNESKTFRQWVGVYVGTDTWLKFGIDLIFGLDADKTATQSESMFLPEILMAELQTASVVNLKDKDRKFVSTRRVLVNKVDRKEEDTNSLIIFKPIGLSVALLLMGIVITLWDSSRRRHQKTFDTVLLVLSGLGGFVLLFLMLVSTHPLVRWNLNLLWLNPLNVIIAFLIWIKSTELRRILFYYQVFNIGLLVASLFAFALSVQALNIATFPLIVLLLLRSTRWFAYTKRKLYKRRDLK